jgi:hypothetical protein
MMGGVHRPSRQPTSGLAGWNADTAVYDADHGWVCNAAPRLRTTPRALNRLGSSKAGNVEENTLAIEDPRANVPIDRRSRAAWDLCGREAAVTTTDGRKRTKPANLPGEAPTQNSAEEANQ